jgi:peroxiredoxin
MDRAIPRPRPLPPDLPRPDDDGAAGNLLGSPIPSVRLESTTGGWVDVADWAQGGLVLYVFPKMGPPESPDPPGWEQIPGAYGCTQQSCAFRDLRSRFGEHGYLVAGVSAQPIDEQLDTQERLQLGFPLLADPDLVLARELGIPTFSVAGTTLYKRLTLVARGLRVEKVFYPVFPPDENPEEVLAWLDSRRA